MCQQQTAVRFIQIAGAFIAHRRVHLGQQQKCVHAPVPSRQHGGQSGAGAFHPDGIGIEHKERRAAEMRQSLNHAAPGIQQLVAFIGENDFDIAAAGQMGAQHLGLVVKIHHRQCHASRHQPIERMVNQSLAAHHHQRLGPVVGQRPHAAAESRAHDHRGGDFVQDISRARLFLGITRPYHARNSAKAGCARSRSR